MATALVSRVVAVVGFTGISVSALTNEPTGAALRAPDSSSAPQLAGTVVNVTLMDMGGNMMGGGSGMMGGGNRTTSGAAMGLSLDRPTAGKGTVSFLAVNGFGTVH